MQELVFALSFTTIISLVAKSSVPPWKWLLALLIPWYMAKNAIRKKRLDTGGAFAAFIVGFILIMCNYSFFVAMVTFFLAGSKVTKYKADIKRKIEDGYKTGGQRNWVQVFTNSITAVCFAVHYAFQTGFQETPLDFERRYHPTWLIVAMVSSLACCSGDTWASEIGSVSGPDYPILITSWEPVPAGTNGGVSLVGTVASIAGGTIVGMSYYASFVVVAFFQGAAYPPNQWFIIVSAALAGFLGSIIDSILGATFQYSGYCSKKKQVVNTPSATTQRICGAPIISNEGVNLLASLLTGLIIPPLTVRMWPR